LFLFFIVVVVEIILYVCHHAKNGCQNVYFSGCDRTFHQFPTETVLQLQWVTRLTRANWSPRKDSVVCSDHFTADSFVERVIPGCFSRRRLKAGAVPTVFSVEQVIKNSHLRIQKIYADLNWLDEVFWQYLTLA